MDDLNDYYIDLPKDNIEYLVRLSKYTNINIFKKNNNKMVLKDRRIIVNECNKVKKLKIKNLSNDLKTRSNKNIKIDEIKNINSKTISDINNIDSIIEIINNNDNPSRYLTLPIAPQSIISPILSHIDGAASNVPMVVVFVDHDVSASLRLIRVTVGLHIA